MHFPQDRSSLFDYSRTQMFGLLFFREHFSQCGHALKELYFKFFITIEDRQLIFGLFSSFFPNRF